MKRIVLSALLLCGAAVFSFGQTGMPVAQKFSLKGKVKAHADSMNVFLVFRNNGIQTLSSDIEADGSFSMSGISEGPQRSTLYMAKKAEQIRSLAEVDQVTVFLEKGTIEVLADSSFKTARVAGTPLNNDQQAYLDTAGHIRSSMLEIARNFRIEKDEQKRQQLGMAYQEQLKQLTVVIADFIKIHPGSLVSFLVLRDNFIPSDDAGTAKRLFNMLDEPLRKTRSGMAYEAAIEDTYKFAVGNQAPDFSAKDAAGVVKHLTDFKGKYVLLDFWASWCGPCRKESPNLVKSYSRYKNKKFEIISFSVDQSSEEWRKAIEKDKYTWINLKDNGNVEESVAKLYSVTALPTNFLLDPSGKIVAVNLRGEELEQQLAAILN